MRELFNKKNIKIISLFISIIGLLCLLMGSTYAILDKSYESTNKQVINVGKVKLLLTESKDGINFDNLIDMTDEEGFKSGDFYTFNISNIGDTPAEYDLLLISDVSKTNTLDERYIKVGLEVNGETIIVNLNEVNNIIHSTVINVNEDIEYKLRLWIDPSFDISDIKDDTSLNLKLNVNVTQYMGDTSMQNTFYNLMKNEVKETNISYKYINNANKTESGIAYNTNDNGVFLFNGTDDNGGSLPIYYYRGNVLNNNVIFGGFCFKIVRTTSTGGTKLIYNGIPSDDGKCNNTGEDTAIGTSAFNSNQNSPADVGYMYGERYTYSSKEPTGTIIYGNDVTYSDGTYTLVDTKSSTSWSSDYKTLANGYHYTCFNSTGVCDEVYYITYYGSSSAFYLTFTNGETLDTAKTKMFSNTNDSKVKEVIDEWYKNNLIDYTESLENTIFCNDRSSASDSTNVGSLSNKDANGTNYSSFKSIENTKNGTPSLSCSNINDRFSLKENNGGTSGYGNNTLTYPVGLLTYDEIELAGGQFANNSNYYLYTGESFRLLSPGTWYDNNACVGIVYSNGNMNNWFTSASFGVRPVISLKQDTLILKGSGLSNDPYITW